jgi:hypothetical protein
MLYLIHVGRYMAHPHGGINDMVGWDHTSDPRDDKLVCILFLSFFPADRGGDTPLVSAYGISHKPRILFDVFEGHTSLSVVRIGECKSVGVEEWASKNVFAPKGDQWAGPLGTRDYIM